MDLFDSATPEMKRLRNQKKDVSKLAQMKALSSEITPTEIVYSIDGEFQKERDIFGPLSCETSPVSPLVQYFPNLIHQLTLFRPRLKFLPSSVLLAEQPQKRQTSMLLACEQEQLRSSEDKAL
jgi:hypothetical protein